MTEEMKEAIRIVWPIVKECNVKIRELICLLKYINIISKNAIVAKNAGIALRYRLANILR